MRPSKLLYYLTLLLVTSIFLIHTSGCQKEYSFEGGDSSFIIHDSISQPPVIKEFPSCSLCNEKDAVALGSWNFKTGNSYLCGTVTNGGFVGGTTFFTFFGPSACSDDTGLVMSVYLPISFDQDRENVIASHIALYYYNHNSPNDIFDSEPPYPFQFIIQSYSQSTGIATGTFSGTVYRPNGDTAHIEDGRFKVKLK